MPAPAQSRRDGRPGELARIGAGRHQIPCPRACRLPQHGLARHQPGGDRRARTAPGARASCWRTARQRTATRPGGGPGTARRTRADRRSGPRPRASGPGPGGGRASSAAPSALCPTAGRRCDPSPQLTRDQRPVHVRRSGAAGRPAGPGPSPRSGCPGWPRRAARSRRSGRPVGPGRWTSAPSPSGSEQVPVPTSVPAGQPRAGLAAEVRPRSRSWRTPRRAARAAPRPGRRSLPGSHSSSSSQNATSSVSSASTPVLRAPARPGVRLLTSTRTRRVGQAAVGQAAVRLAAVVHDHGPQPGPGSPGRAPRPARPAAGRAGPGSGSPRRRQAS